MVNDILIRLAWTAGIIVLGLLLFRLISSMVLSRANGSQHRPEGLLPGKPAILYFTTPECVPCKTVQRPALRRVQTRLGDRLQIIEIDASQQPELAKEWGVLSVPTTFLLDEKGVARHVNHGATTAEKLIEQMRKENILSQID